MFSNTEARVRAGMALLDARLPDWHWRVNLDKLDQLYARRCVLGQLLGNHWDGHGPVWTGTEAISAMTPAEAYRLGFIQRQLPRIVNWLVKLTFSNRVADLVNQWNDSRYAPLTNAWRDAIVDKQLVDILVADTERALNLNKQEEEVPVATVVDEWDREPPTEYEW